MQRAAVLAAAAVVGLNVWTGGPLLALWLGSRAQGTGPPSMGAVGIVIVALVAISIGLYRALQATSQAFRQHAPWLRSMRGERPSYDGMQPTLTSGERILVGGVILAFAAFEIWFFFFSGSPIGAN